MFDHPHRPLIGVTVGRDVPDRPSVLRLTENYVHALTNSGAIPVVITTGLDTAAILTLVERVDGLLLPGGVDAPDPHPRHYGEETQPATVVDENLDALEIVAINRATRLGMPILGVCRGCQILNVALGGSLIQHLQPGTVNHLPHLPLDFQTHELRLTAGSRLATSAGEELVRVNSLHHQAIARTATTLRVVGTAEDGVVEAVESTDPDQWIVGVQYHPEELLHQPAHRRLFDDFVTACAHFAAARTTERNTSPCLP
ncbi:gamma-glutamyl-gamma-aminobutyrate hydrolase family protein [Streptomyces sp. WSLK1-5]|uniref:gamma-glutamyl-gamma-aminobutyrate hydrolase family protein n=1 Tax=unclassified Streptomyces TaxID=2593676 RepID=UPI000F651D32|nr:gamma-glutamyl-gamma-aminobutyrate hydrolase family protein [Streptomyces sp. RP5T]RRR83157.1 gamma-glutamyl-gamma-aminobutyrate hydrolase family protein [Streptomyces sp. RP5T]